MRKRTNIPATLTAILFAFVIAGCSEQGRAQDAAKRLSESESAAVEDAKVIAELRLTESERPLREMREGWEPPMKVMVHVRDDQSRLAWMEKARPPGSDITMIAVADKEEALAKLDGVDGLIGSVRWCTRDLLQAGEALRWVHTNAAGVNECDMETMRARNIILTNQQRTFAPEISDHVIGLLLGLTRGLDGNLKAQFQGKWQRGNVSRERLWRLEDRTMLVVGLGGIGTEVARKAHALGMRVIATRNSSREGPDFVDYVGLSHELSDLIGDADVVVNATPLTPETTGLFDAEMFARMQPHAYFISVGRGPTTVTEDLIAALENGVIGGAGLDVTDPEPLPDNHPLMFAPNIIITPHMSASGVEAGPSGDRPWRVMREQLRRFIAGDKMLSVVDLEQGY
jgi:phosphoglycerate dehydrogenase-like enzyme